MSYIKWLLSWETFRCEPATTQFDWSFATIHILNHRFARQNDYGLPINCCLSSTRTCIVHCVSGLIIITYQINNDYILYLAIIIISLVRVSRRVLKNKANTHTFSQIPSQYLFAIGIPLYLTLDISFYLYSNCTTKQPYSKKLFYSIK